MRTSDTHMTAHIVRTEDGENYTECRLGDVSYPSAEAIEAG